MKFEKLLEKLYFQLEEIKNENFAIIQESNASIIVCRNVLSNMNHLVLSSGFKNNAEEIDFFKKTKILPLSQLIYFSEIHSFELQFPRVCIEDQHQYIKTKIRAINKFLDANIDFMQYINEKSKHLDDLYFLRANNYSINLANTDSYFRTPEFSTSHDIILGRITGFNLLLTYLENRLFSVNHPTSVKTMDIHKKPKLRWTSSKVSLTELIYALHSSGAINSGAADIKEIAALTERIFNIELGDYYRTFLEIRGRKSNRAKFMEKLTTSLIKRMDNIDE
jgi:hypothetical protein